MIERGSSTDGAGAQSPLVERAQKIHYRVSKNVLYPKMQNFKNFITIKTIKFGILIYFSDRAILLAFLGILNQGNRPNKTKNT